MPQSLRAQFTLAFLTLALLILAGGATAVYALRTSNSATRQLTDERLVRMQNGQDMVQRTLLIERQTDQLLTTVPPTPCVQAMRRPSNSLKPLINWCRS